MRRALTGGAALVALLIVGAGSNLLAQESRPTSARATSQATTLPANEPLAPDTLFALASPEVVKLSIKDEDDREVGSASAFIVAHQRTKVEIEMSPPAGVTLVTNCHVLRPAVRIDVLFSDGARGWVWQVVAEDAASDVALLSAIVSFVEPPRGMASDPIIFAEIDAWKRRVRALTLHQGADLPIGSKVYAIGSPRGLANTLSEGLISGYRPRAERKPWIQITAPVSPGSSGGPLLSAEGAVLGVITSSVVDGQNLNFAVPASEISRLLGKPGKPRLLGQVARAADEAKVRPAACAGSWYPGDAATLAKTVDDLLAQAKPPGVEGKPVAVICPHAGYQYSAPTAAAVYAALRGQTYKRVIVLAFSHRNAGRYRGIDVPKELTAYKTPLGEVPIDREACDRLLKDALFTSTPAVDAGEHSLELQLPFLQRVVKDFKLVPLLVGQMADADYAKAAQTLVPLADGETLLVASTDCTHFGPNYGYTPFKDDVEKKLKELAEGAATALTRCDYDGFAAHLEKTGDTICGRNSVQLLLRVLSMQGGAAGVRAAYDTSGHQAGDYTNSVTYQSFVFTRRPGTLNADERGELLRLARQTVAATAKGAAPPKVDADKLSAALRAKGACFVTLQKQGDLRGCIGNMVADGPLYEAVVRNAVNAAREDPRFSPVRSDEVDQLHVEISYLTPMKRISSPDEIVVGRHGLLITLGMNRGVLLPQVAYERGWTRKEFLEQTCHKAGLPSDAWKRSEAQLDVFEAEVFGEPESQK